MTRHRVASTGMTRLPEGRRPVAAPVRSWPFTHGACTGRSEGASCRRGETGTMKGQGVRSVTEALERPPPCFFHGIPEPPAHRTPAHLAEHLGHAPGAAVRGAGGGQHPVPAGAATAAAGHTLVDPGLSQPAGAQPGVLFPLWSPQAQAPQRPPRAGPPPGGAPRSAPHPATARDAGLTPLAAGPGTGGHRVWQRTAAPSTGAADPDRR